MWLDLDGDVIFIPGCYSAALGNPVDCSCSDNEGELVIDTGKARVLLERERGIPGATEALDLLADATDKIRLPALLRPLRARSKRANAEHGAALDRWRLAHVGRSMNDTDMDAFKRCVEPWWRDCGRIERLIAAVADLATAPRGTVAQRAKRHPQKPSKEPLRLLAEAAEADRSA